MPEAAYSIDDAVTDLTDLVEAPESVPASYSSGTLDQQADADQDQSIAEAAESLADDDGHGRSGKTVAHHNGHALTLQQLDQGFGEGLQLAALLQDYHSRLRWVQQAGENVVISAYAIADLIVALFPSPTVELANADPLEYQRAKVVADQIHDVVIGVCEQAQHAARQQAAWASSQIPLENLELEKARFLEAYPEANDPAWMEQYRARITQAAESCGYHSSEMDGIIDHRALKVLDLAATALERRPGAKREAAQQTRSKPRLVANGGSLSMREAMDLID